MGKFQTGETVTYRVLAAYTPVMLEKVVNEHLQLGFVTIGGVSVSGTSAMGEEVLYQAVEKREAVYKHGFTVPFDESNYEKDQATGIVLTKDPSGSGQTRRTIPKGKE